MTSWQEDVAAYSAALPERSRFVFDLREIRVTPLDDRGRPSGPSTVLTPSTITLTERTSNMPDNETKPDRPTRAGMEALTRRVDLLEGLLGRARSDLEAMTLDRDSWQQAHAPDPEAEAIAGCVRAIDEMRSGGRSAARANRGMSYMGEATTWAPPRPQDVPEGRVLLNLAARYGVALVPAPEPEPIDRGGQRLVSVPAHVAEQLERLPGSVFES